jgi:photosystem II stability/assembly factor-like uncharacterized protein
MRLSVVSAATLVAAAVVLPASGLHAQVRDTTRQARDSLRRDAARRPSARGDSASRGDTARVGAGGARDTTQRARGDSEPPSPYNGLRFRSIGPAVTSGRVSDIAVHPRDKRTWYVAIASGGVWKTTNAGTTWTPIFDSQASYSIANVVIDPKNPNVVWVGTGENNAQRSVSYGDGVYKSIDGGRTWQNVGLKQSEHIGRILIDPRNSDVVYVAAQGPLFSRGGDRGLFKTTDGGKTWKKVLDGGEWSGASDIALDPRNPDIVIATTWQRFRRQWGYIAGGPQSGLWRSTDAGATWKKSQTGLPTEDLGRIGLAVAPANPDVVYAIAEAANARGGFFRSRDGGVNWERMSGYQAGGLYYNEIFPDPVNVDRVYSVDVQTMITDDGGRNFRRLGERNKHVDNHVVWIDPDETEHLLIGCDGGLYESFDRGQTYKFFANLPVTQFYHVDTDNALPFYRVYGGTQDNFSLGGPSRTRTEHGITNADWFVTAGGDGFQSRVDPKDPNTVYAESQHGNLQRFNLATGESINIVPQSEPGEEPLRWHWDSPLIISPHANTRLYFASDRVYRSDDRGTSWKAVSPDLSRQIDRNRLKMMDRVWSVDAVAKNTSTSLYGSVVTLAESPVKDGVLIAGTDDGLIQISENAGQTWRKISRFPGVPDTTFVSRVTASQHDANVVYASFDNHKSGDYKPYVLKSTDLGRSWTSIAGNLPERGTAYVVIEDHIDRNLLFVGTEFGLYATTNGGQHWTRLRGGLPTIQVRDLAIQKREDDLVVATFGRGFYILDDLSPLRGLTPPVVAREATLFPVKRASMYVLSSPLGGTGASFQGASFFLTPNPAPGAVFTYHLNRELRSRRARRQAAERDAARRGQDVMYPPWDSLKVEDQEEAPTMILTVTDAEGRVVRRLTGPTTAGVQRVTWNLRYPAPNPVAAAGAGGAGGGGGGGGGGANDEPDQETPFGGGGPAGPMVAPGRYTVALAKRVDGVVTALGDPQSFMVAPLDSGSTPRSPAVVAFQQKTAALQRALLGANAVANETMSRVQLLKRAVQETPSADAKLDAEVRRIETGLRDIQTALAGDPTMARRSEPAPPSLLNRVNGIANSLWSNTMEDATATQKRQYDIAAAELGGLLDRLRTLVEQDLKRVGDQAETAGVPWTSGRVPVWKP